MIITETKDWIESVRDEEQTPTAYLKYVEVSVLKYMTLYRKS